MITSPAAKRTPPERILLIGDNRHGLRARTVFLEELGYDVTALNCSQKALEHFATQPFDLVVTDYRMPVLDGIQLTVRLRERNPVIRVILISGVAEALGLDETNTGADVVVQKNCHEVATLTRAVNRLLAHKPARKPVRSQATRRARAVAQR